MKKFFKSILSVSIVMLGAYFTSFYIQNHITFTSVFVGIVGLLILFPAINSWNEILWGKDANQK